MLKFTQLIGFFLIYLSAQAQKPFFYTNPGTDLNKYSYFFMPGASMDAHEITSPFIDKAGLKPIDYEYFILYNEMSLKNLTLLDGKSEAGTLLLRLYEGSSFNNEVNLPKGYKKRKIVGDFLVLDMIDGTNQELVWRGWINMRGVKAKSEALRYQKAISLILLNFKIDPTIIE